MGESCGREKITSLSASDIGKDINGGIVVPVRIIYERDNFVIFACKGGFSVKGSSIEKIAAGAEYRVFGTVTLYNKSAQISASRIEAREDITDDVYVAGFIEDNFEGLGPKKASELAKIYGREFLDLVAGDFDNALKSIQGLKKEDLLKVIEKIEAEREDLNFLLKLRLLNVGNRTSLKILRLFGNDFYDDIKLNPYILMRVPGIGFETCELISEKLNKEPLSVGRFEGAIQSSLMFLHEQTGDSFFCSSEVRRTVRTLLLKKNADDISDDVFDSLYEEAVSLAVKDKFIVIYKFENNKCVGCSMEDEDARVASHLYFVTELSIKRHIENLVKRKKKLPDEAKTRNKIRSIARKKGIVLDALQEDALYISTSSRISIITGGPGTGKTTITNILADFFKNSGIKAGFCAPTGRAAKRLTEASGEQAFTIHRMLEVSIPSTDSDEVDDEAFFGRNKNNPLDYDVVIADEASMIDMFLFEGLLEALKPDASLILIGDPEQLPSVGSGNVLSDLIISGVISCVRLSYVFRQKEECSIPSNALMILKGEQPVKSDDFQIIRTSSDEEALSCIKELSLKEKDNDFILLSPTRKNLLGTKNLNDFLQKSHNEGKADPVKVREDFALFTGDPVMQIKNDYSLEYFDKTTESIERGVFNGETGRFLKFNRLDGTYDVVFDGQREVGYDKKNISDIELAYAVTVHKAQGCEFDHVLIALGSMNYKLSNRRLLYTAVTRGKKKVTVIDSGNRLAKMLKSQSDVIRKTSLPDFLFIIAEKYL